MEKELGQLFFIGLEGPELKTHEAEFIVRNNIGGVTLFGRNCESPKQLHKLCSDIQSLRSQMPDAAPLFIGIDMEGGRVHRLKAPFTQWPAMKKVGDLNSTSIAFKIGQSMGSELKAVGINLNYSPCLDVYTNPKNEIIGDRSFSTDPELVATMGSAITRGFIKADILPCAKHFPGHGNTLLDSHEDLPIEETDLETLMNREMVPFQKVFRARLDFVMMAHIRYQNIDPEFPATLSHKFVTEILKDTLKYRNLVLTDDLDMGALRKHYAVEDIPLLALNAGCNVLLYCNEPDSHRIGFESCIKALESDKISRQHITESYQKIMDIKKKKLTQPDPLPFDEGKTFIGHPEHFKIAKAVNEGEIPEELTTT